MNVISPKVDRVVLKAWNVFIILVNICVILTKQMVIVRIHGNHCVSKLATAASLRGECLRLFQYNWNLTVKMCWAKCISHRNVQREVDKFVIKLHNYGHKLLTHFCPMMTFQKVTSCSQTMTEDFSSNIRTLLVGWFPLSIMYIYVFSYRFYMLSANSSWLTATEI